VAGWTLARDWATSNTLAWTPQTPGTGYIVAAWARSAGSVLDGPEGGTAIAQMSYVITGTGGSTPLAITSLTSNRASPRSLGTTTVFTATASGGAAPYDYKWWVFDGIVWRAAQNWSGSNQFYWTPTSAGSGYFVAVWGRSAGNSQDAADNASAVGTVPFVITP